MATPTLSISPNSRGSSQILSTINESCSFPGVPLVVVVDGVFWHVEDQVNRFCNTAAHCLSLWIIWRIIHTEIAQITFVESLDLMQTKLTLYIKKSQPPYE